MTLHLVVFRVQERSLFHQGDHFISQSFDGTRREIKKLQNDFEIVANRGGNFFCGRHDRHSVIFIGF